MRDVIALRRDARCPGNSPLYRYRNTVIPVYAVFRDVNRAVFVRFSLGGGQSFDWRLATIADMEVAKLAPWNSLLK